MNVFGVGTSELIVILVIAILVVGPERMVKFSRDAGKWLAKFREMTDSVTKEFRETLSLEDEEGETSEAQQAVVEGSDASPRVIDASAKVVGEVVPALEGGPTEAPAELPLSEAAQLEMDLASELVDGEIRVGSPVEMVLSEGGAGQDVESLPGLSLDPMTVEIAELVPEDAEVEPVDVDQVVLVTDEGGGGDAVGGEG